MMSKRGIAVAIVLTMLGGLISLAAAPEVQAQAASGNTYHVPPRFDADPGCPAGQSEIYAVDASGGTAGPITIRYCNFPASEGRVAVSTEVECLEARANGVPGAGWIPEGNVCFGGGNLAAGLTAADCQGSVFVPGIVHPNPAVGTVDGCVVPVYKAAGVNVVVPADAVTAWGLQGVLASVELSQAFLDRLEANGLIEVATNPIVYNGPVPADGVLRFTIPAGLENAQYTVRAAAADGSQLTFTFSFNDALPGALRPFVPPPPPEIELALTDPYDCGGGFTGHITNGTPPYTISYRIDSTWYSADLGSFVSDTGQFETPDGYLDYGQIPEAWYSVSISISDSAQWTRSLSLIGFATEYLTDDCGGTVESVPVPVAVPADDAQPVGLAHTGATTDAALLVSQLLLGLGLSTLALLRLAHLRRRDED